MKKNLIFTLLVALLSTGVFAQVTTDIYINGLKTGQIILNANATEGGISYKKSIYKTIDRLSIQIQGKSIDGGYYRKALVMGDDTTPMLIASETVGAAGQFVLTDKKIIKR